MDERVLFVDDDSNLLNGYKRCFRSFFQIETAENAEKGLEILSGDKEIAVVVSDMKMPGIGGLHFLEKVKKDYPKTIRIMLTGYPEQETVIGAINTGGIFQFLEKPCSEGDLRNSIEEAIKLFRKKIPKVLGHNLASIKETVSQQKIKIRQIEKENFQLVRKHKTEKKSQDENFKKKLEEEKISLLEKMQSFEEQNQNYKSRLDKANADLKSLPLLKQELETIQSLLGNEKNMQEELLSEKNEAETKLKQLMEKYRELKKDSTDTQKHKNENLQLKEKLAQLKGRLKKENSGIAGDVQGELEKEIEKYQFEVERLKNQLIEVDSEKREIEKYQLEIEALEKHIQSREEGEKAETHQIIGELESLDNSANAFSKILEFYNESFKVQEETLSNKTSFEERIQKLDKFIKKSKEHIEQIVSEDNQTEKSDIHSTQVVEFLNFRIEKDEKIKKLLIQQKKESSSVSDEGQSVIIQKKVFKKNAAHGGSWKVAYADFVTAMMAFFLMMWLVSQLSQESRDNLKDYFASYKAFKHSGKEIADAADSVRSSNVKDKVLAQKQMIEEFKNRFKGSDEHFKVVDAPGGVRVQVMDLSDQPMFKLGKAQFTYEAVALMQFLAERIKELPGRIIIEGHTDALPFNGGIGKRTNWELAMDRASAARIILVKNGVSEKRFLRIVSYGSSEPLNHKNLLDPINRRVNIIIMSPPSPSG
jgi:chemotaxis protein MotB